MKRRILSVVLVLILFVMIPAETTLAMSATYQGNENMVTLLEEIVATEEVVDETIMEADDEEEATAEPTEVPAEEEAAESTEVPAEEEAAEPTEVPAEEEAAEPTEVPAEEEAAESTEVPAEEEAAEPTEAPAEEEMAETTEVPDEAPVTTQFEEEVLFDELNKVNVTNAEADDSNELKLNKAKLSLESGETYQMKLLKGKKVLDSDVVKKYAPVWGSSNTGVATVTQSGKIKAICPGDVTISCTISGVKLECTLYVYKVTGLKFSNNKSSDSYTYRNGDAVFDSEDEHWTTIYVMLENEAYTAEEIQTVMGVQGPVVKSSNKKVATATATLSGNEIRLTIASKKAGSATVTVTFAGKKATYKLKNKYLIESKANSQWFDLTKVINADNTVYTGKAITPKVKLSKSAPKDLTYTVRYERNKNVGTACVKITGTGNYCGTLTRTYKILQKNISKVKIKSCTTSRIYNGAKQKATTTVMLGNKELKAGRDYEVLYNNTTEVPSDAGTYTVVIWGKGNYTGRIEVNGEPVTKKYVIKPLKLNKATVTCTASRKYIGSTVKEPVVTVKYGKKVIPATQYTVTYTKGGMPISAAELKDVGTYKVIITPKGDNFIAGTKLKQVTKTFKIVKK